jgi:hypothetical protein
VTRNRSTVVMAGLGLAAGLGFTAAPAQAVVQTEPTAARAASASTFPPPCQIDRRIYRLTSPNQVVANHVSVCDDGSSVGLGVTLKGRTASGTWVTVGTGDATVVHPCGGSPRYYEFWVPQTGRKLISIC